MDNKFRIRKQVSDAKLEGDKSNNISISKGLNLPKNKLKKNNKD
jgi:hypothetical protein